jgi:glycine cleavage system T protein (aminomethyltransferase)
VESQPAGENKKTALYELHCQMGARMVAFGGWEMPVWYSGIVEEHHAVRKAAGLFDVSHMGEFWVEGPEAVPALDAVVVCDVGAIPPGRAKYTLLLTEDGGIVDDLLVYKVSNERLLCVVNAGTRAGDFVHMQTHLRGEASLTDRTFETSLLALQGPHSREILAPLWTAPPKLPYYGFVDATVAGVPCLVSRTGYTGEFGYELMTGWDDGRLLWKSLMEAGERHGLKPVGLGARDTLRLEAGMLLYGNDMDRATTPLEAGLDKVVAWHKEFVGRSALLAQRDAGVRRRLVALEMTEKAIPRHGYPVLDRQGRSIGVVTSGTQSPTLGKSIALAYVEATHTAPGTDLAVEIRGAAKGARIVETPFYKRPSPAGP